MWGNLHSIQMRPCRGLENWLILVGEAQKYLHFESSLKSGFVQKFSGGFIVTSDHCSTVGATEVQLTNVFALARFLFGFYISISNLN